MKQISLSLAALVLVLSGQARAILISDLYNTGVDPSGSALPDFVTDPHYSLIAVPGGLPLAVARTSAFGYPIPPYLPPDSPISAWIGPFNAIDLDGPVGNYTYRTTFDLTGFDPMTASIRGQWSTDNDGFDILINGNSLGYTTSVTQFSLGYLPFLINSGFVSGVNSLDFVVHNDLLPPGSTGSNPTALRVEILDSNVSAVPEASAFFFAGLSLCSSGGVYLLRRAKIIG